MHHFWRTKFHNFDPSRPTHSNYFQSHQGRMMYYRGPSRFLWFTVGAFAATWYHRAHARGEFRGWGPCGNRRIEEWRAERAAGAAIKEQFPTNTARQPNKTEAPGEWSWRPAAPLSSEDEVVRRRWEEKTREAQETVRIFARLQSGSVLTEDFLNPGRRPVRVCSRRNPGRCGISQSRKWDLHSSVSAVNVQRLRFE